MRRCQVSTGPGMEEMQRGRYRARLGSSAVDIRRAQALRWLCFRAAQQDPPTEDGARLDADAFDAVCDHALIEDIQTGDLVGCFRVMRIGSGAEVSHSYSAQYYGLERLAAHPGPMVELGRFCLHPQRSDPHILRLAWAFLTALVEDCGAGVLFGCSSFMGTDWDAYRDSFGLLRERHLAPRRWRPRIKAPQVVRFASRLRLFSPDRARALSGMPPLLRSYLALGGWVSDHAVIDRDLNTLHVFTALEVGAVPVRRVMSLRLLASGAPGRIAPA